MAVTQTLTPAYPQYAPGGQPKDYEQAAQPMFEPSAAKTLSERDTEVEEVKRALSSMSETLHQERAKNQQDMADLVERLQHLTLMMVAVVGFGLAMVSVYWCSKLANPIAAFALLFFLTFYHMYG